MTCTDSSSEFRTSGENYLTALPERFVPVIQNIGWSYRVRQSNSFPLDLKTTKISAYSASHLPVQNSTTNISNYRPYPIQKWIGKVEIIEREENNGNPAKKFPIFYEVA